MTAPLTTGVKIIDRQLTPAAMRLWHSPEFSPIVEATHKKQWRLLATYACDFATLEQVRAEIARIQKAGGNPYVSVMAGQGEVESPLSKQESRLERRLRQAEASLGLTRKELGERVDDEAKDGEAAHDFGG